VNAEPLSTLSPSRASDFKTCPQLFKFRAVDRMDEPPTPPQARGTTAHLALQHLYDLPAAERTPAALADLFETVDEERAWGIDSLELLANYFAIEDPARIDPLGRELDMTEELGEITIRGILDRIDENDAGELVITDYKTGKAPPERFALPAFFALKIYALLIRTSMGRTPVELRLLYLNGPTLYRIPVSDAQLDAMQRQLEALWATINRAIDRDRFPAKPSRLCDWCSFQALCPAWQTDDVEAAAGVVAAQAAEPTPASPVPAAAAVGASST
jgi:putative RecB family exonuclease